MAETAGQVGNREALAREPLAHGGNLSAARRRFPGALLPLVDLSTGINPVAYPLDAIAAPTLTRLPDPADEAALRHVAAAAYGVRDPACVVAAPGTQILISLIPRLFRHRSVAVLGPTYAEHAESWRLAGATVREVATLDDLATADAAVIGNPNNPDGRRTAPADLVRLADALGRRGGLLIVDEAFADLEDDVSVAPALPHPALLVLRSFGKTYGLAGIRLGFALASPARARSIGQCLGPWAVSGPAIMAGLAALPDGAWRAAARTRLDGDVARLDAVMRGAGMTIVGGTRLFRLADDPHAAASFERFGRAGIVVRRFADAPHWLRFGLPGDPAAWSRLALAADAEARVVEMDSRAPMAEPAPPNSGD